mgnify:CR=1 FL=1
MQTRDIIAGVLIAVLFLMKFLGFDGTIDNSILLVIGYYFGKRV